MSIEIPTSAPPRWSVADLHESMIARSFVSALDQSAADTDRLDVLRARVADYERLAGELVTADPFAGAPLERS
ncbi:MAG: hypothetical protein ABIW84_06560 [Ilumatobacteraceae bacterium]